MGAEYRKGGTTAGITYESGLQRSLARYQSMIKDLQVSKTEAAAPLAPEYQQLVDIYRTGGEYGAGARTRIAEAQKMGTAADVAGLARSGMSSQAISSGVAARRSRYAQGQIQEVEDVRYEKLGAALQAVATARESRGMRMTQAYQTSAQLVGGFQEPAKSQYESDIDYAKARAEGEQRTAAIQATFAQQAQETKFKQEKEMAKYQKELGSREYI